MNITKVIMASIISAATTGGQCGDAPAAVQGQFTLTRVS